MSFVLFSDTKIGIKRNLWVRQEIDWKLDTLFYFLRDVCIDPLQRYAHRPMVIVVLRHPGEIGEIRAAAASFSFLFRSITR